MPLLFDVAIILAAAFPLLFLGKRFRVPEVIAYLATAVVLPILATRDEMGAPFARRFLGVSLFQDLAVIPLMLLVPAFASGGNAPPLPHVLKRVAIAVVGVFALILIARVIVPRLFRRIAALGSREVFTAGV